MAFETAGLMTDHSVIVETPDVAETTNFLRRFADLMVNGQNARYLRHAATLLETMTASVTAASQEEQLWRYKCETVTHHADLLEAECNALKHDIEGHLDITTSILAERDALKTALQAREAELGDLRVAFDREREEIKTTLAERSEELDQLRRGYGRERGELVAKFKAREEGLSELCLGFERGQHELRAQLKVRGDELAALRVVYERECQALRAKVAALEAKPAEPHAAFDSISDWRNRTTEHNDAADRSIADRNLKMNLLPAQRGDQGPAPEEADAVVSRATLRQARAQFEYLANECIRRGDIASQVMCELGAHTIDLALIGDVEKDHLQVGEVARSILAPSDSTSAVISATWA